MSEYINNNQKRQEVLKRLIRGLHEGQDVAQVKEEFRRLLKDVSATEISQMEQALIAEGLPPEQIKALCDVHTQVFRESLDRQAAPGMSPGHPVYTFRRENEAIAQVVAALKQNIEELKTAGNLQAAAPAVQKAKMALSQLMEVDKHYLRKENLLFPFLEKHGASGPSAVMWAIHDDIRGWLKELQRILDGYASYDWAAFTAAIGKVASPLTTAITEMIYKENNILFAMALEKLSDAEWLAIQEQSPELGFFPLGPAGEEMPTVAAKQLTPTATPSATAEAHPAAIALDTGSMTPEEINLVLKHLPVDITFVDKDDTVRYFSQTKERIFPRAKAVIGRKVQNCHPPASVHVVNRILNDFRQGKRDVAEFWIQVKGMFVHIRYFALRNEKGEYVGTLEVTQELTHLRELTGERRLLEDI